MNSSLFASFDMVWPARNSCCSGRSGAAIRQVAHLHDFVDGENDVQFDGLEDVLIARLHRIAANEGGGVLGHKDWSLPYSAMAAFVSLMLSAFS